MNALELADKLEQDPTEWGGLGKVAWPAAAMLRKLHAENEANERNLGILSDELSKCEKHAKDLQTECTALRVNEENLTAQVESLRAQLEQKSERIAHLEATASSNYGRGHADAHQMAAQQAPVAQGEPVAWLVCSVNKDGSLSLEHAAAWREAAHEHINDAITEYGIEDAATWVVRPAYTHPQQASEPMTDEQINHEAVKVQGFGHLGWEGFVAGVRFAERHHQNKGK
jgi:hypothetical protein